MKSLIFDAGPIISLATNNLLGLLKQLRAKFKGEFYLCEAVKKELIDRPLKSKKFKFEALQIIQAIREDILQVISKEEIKKKAEQLYQLANNCFTARGHFLHIVSYADMETLATALYLNSSAIVVDERTVRLLIEEPKKLVHFFEHRFHTNVTYDPKVAREFQSEVKKIKLIRSVELVTIAFEKGMLDEFIPNKTKQVIDPKKTLLDAVLWALKIRGCAISKMEIKRLLKIERKYTN